MVASCCAFNCTNRNTPNCGIPFHRFPHSNPPLLEKWKHAIRRENWTPSNRTYICGQHFKPEDYITTAKRRCLRPNSVPSIFNFPQHLKNKSTPRRILKRLPTVIDDPGPSVKRRKISVSDEVRTLKLEVVSMRRKMKALKEKVRRRNKKISTMADLFSELKERQLLNIDEVLLISSGFSGMKLEILKNELKNSNVASHGRRYSDEIIRFAITLNFYSPRAYSYVRSVLCLPHASTLRSIASSVECEPGIMSESLKFLSELTKMDPSKSDWVIMADEMSIRKESHWDSANHCFTGFVDFGGGAFEEILASSALVVMAVNLRVRCKLPVAYYFTHALTGEQLSRIVTDVIKSMWEVGCRVLGCVTDGDWKNRTAAKILGIVINDHEIKSSFPHPVCSGDSVYWIFDTCHLLKLMRNLIGDYKILYSGENGNIKQIRWDYFVKLFDFQELDTLFLANKLSGDHINYATKKMKVSLATQTLSSSVADAIDYAREDLDIAEFGGSEGTTEFIRKIDRLFDYLNSRNPFARGFKAPLKMETISEWEPFVMSMMTFLRNLKGPNKQPISSSRRQTVVNGFCVTINSTIEITKKLLSTHMHRYVMTYRMSQDHLELLFSRIRRKGGWNNNPNTTNFTSCLRALLLKNAISPSISANCLNFEDSDYIEFNVRRFRESQPPAENVTSQVEVQEISALLSDSNLSSWKKEVLFYVAGFVVRSLTSKIDCNLCVAAMYSSNETPQHMSFLLRKNRGGLVTPSKGIHRIICVAEKIFRVLFPDAEHGKKLQTCRFLDLRIESETLSLLRPELYRLFPSLTDHLSDSALEESNHVIKLVRHVVSSFVRIRLYNFAKRFTKRAIFMNRPSIRSKLNKLTLFRNE